MDARTTWPALIRALISGESLTADETAWAMNEIMEGAATPAQIAGFGVALRAKGETVAEMTGLARAMLAHATPISVPGRPDRPGRHAAATARTRSTCPRWRTIVAAAAGARMVKHGNRAASSACGAADVLEALGVVIDLPPGRDRALFAEVGVAFLFAPLYHPALRHAGPMRSELGVPTVFNFLGPLTNPARPTSLAVGVADPRMGAVLAGVLAGRGCSALVFHGGRARRADHHRPVLGLGGADGEVAETEFSTRRARAGPGLAGRPARRRRRAQRGGGPRGAGRRARPGAGHRAAQRGRRAGRGGRRAGPGGGDAALADGYARAAEAVDSGAAAPCSTAGYRSATAWTPVRLTAARPARARAPAGTGPPPVTLHVRAASPAPVHHLVVDPGSVEYGGPGALDLPRSPDLPRNSCR